MRARAATLAIAALVTVPLAGCRPDAPGALGAARGRTRAPSAEDPLADVGTELDRLERELHEDGAG